MSEATIVLPGGVGNEIGVQMSADERLLEPRLVGRIARLHDAYRSSASCDPGQQQQCDPAACPLGAVGAEVEAFCSDISAQLLSFNVSQC